MLDAPKERHIVPMPRFEPWKINLKFMNKLISITEIHIAEGVETDCANCPLALALNEVLKPEYRANVGAYTYHFDSVDPRTGERSGQRSQCFDTPQELSLWIIRFDQHKTNARPKDFMLMIPNEYLEEGETEAA